MVSAAKPIKFGRMKLHPTRMLRRSNQLRRRLTVVAPDTGPRAPTIVAMGSPRGSSKSAKGVRWAGRPPDPSIKLLAEDVALGLVLGFLDGIVDALALGHNVGVQGTQQRLHAGNVLAHRVLRQRLVLGPGELRQVVG